MQPLVKLCRPGGLYAVVAESLAVDHHLHVMTHSRRRAPNAATIPGAQLLRHGVKEFLVAPYSDEEPCSRVRTGPDGATQ